MNFYIWREVTPWTSCQLTAGPVQTGATLCRPDPLLTMLQILKCKWRHRHSEQWTTSLTTKPVEFVLLSAVFGPNQIDLAKKNASLPRQRFFMLSSRSVTIQGPGMYRFTFYHYVSTSITKFKGNWKWNKSNWQKEHLRERHTVCLSMISHSWLCWLSTPSWIFVTAWRRPEEDLNTHRRTHTFLCKYFYICQLRQCVVVVVVAHIFSFCQSNAYHSVTLPLTIKQGCSLGDGGFGGGGVVGGWRGISEHLPLSGRGETKHRHSGLALKHLSGTHG